MLLAAGPVTPQSVKAAPGDKIRKFLKDIQDPKVSPNAIEFYRLDVNKLDFSIPISTKGFPYKDDWIERRVWLARVTANSTDARAELAKLLPVGSAPSAPLNRFDYCIVYRDDQQSRHVVD